MTCTREQIEKLLTYSKTLTVEAAAAKAGMSLRTARTYLQRGGRVKQRKQREYRTRPDPFAEVWDDVRNLLDSDSGLEAKTVLEWLEQRYKGKFSPAQLRTLQRRVRDWRVLEGPERRDVVFPQDIQPGKQSQSDYTHCNELRVEIAGVPFPHMLFHFMLPYSRWEYVELAEVESYDTLTGGYTRAVEALGATAPEHRTDNLAAAVPIGRRGEFQERWTAFLKYYDAEPSANNPGCSNENGSVEKSHDLFKRALDQRLRLRGSRNFGSIDAYESYLRDMVQSRNGHRRDRLKEELKLLNPLPSQNYSDPKDLFVSVSAWSTVSIALAIYSVPSRFISVKLRALVHADRVELYYGPKQILSVPKVQPGERHINYRHIIAHLLRKPRAFKHYRFREELFPSSIFRKTFDHLTARASEEGEQEYLRILNVAAMGSENDVAAALQLLLETDGTISEQSVKDLIVRKFAVPEVHIATSSLSVFDQLLSFERRETATA